MNNQKVNPTPTKKLLRVATPGAAPATGAAPKRLRSASMVPQINPANTRDYGKPPTPSPGFGPSGGI